MSSMVERHADAVLLAGVSAGRIRELLSCLDGVDVPQPEYVWESRVQWLKIEQRERVDVVARQVETEQHYLLRIYSMKEGPGPGSLLNLTDTINKLVEELQG